MVLKRGYKDPFQLNIDQINIELLVTYMCNYQKIYYFY